MVQVGKKFVSFLQENVVIISSLGLIIGIHWGWTKIQQTNLVPEEKRKELPIIIGLKYLGHSIAEKFQETEPKVVAGKK